MPKRLNRSRFHLGADSWVRGTMYWMGSRSSHRKGTFEGDICLPIVIYLRMANIPAQRTQQTNALTTARGDNTAMRPLANSLCTLFCLPLAPPRHLPLATARASYLAHTVDCVRVTYKYKYGIVLCCKMTRDTANFATSQLLLPHSLHLLLARLQIV